MPVLFAIQRSRLHNIPQAKILFHSSNFVFYCHWLRDPLPHCWLVKFQKKKFILDFINQVCIIIE